MVSELQYDPETGLATNTLKQQQFNALNAQDPWSHLQVRRMVALYDYDPLELSPNPGKLNLVNQNYHILKLRLISFL